MAGYCDAGGLASYGANQRATYVRLAAYADRLLRGERPDTLPIERVSIFEFISISGRRATSTSTFRPHSWPVLMR